MKVLVIDVGGTSIKIGISGNPRRIRIPSGPRMTPASMASAVKRSAKTWDYESISIGYPGPVRDGKPSVEPKNLGMGWVGFDYAKAFGKPVRIANDAAMQALGCYRGGRMLFLGLGTGLGSAIVTGGILEPLELGHLPYRKNRTYEDYLGVRGLNRLGRRKWQRHVGKVVSMLTRALQADYVTLGGGNAKKIGRVPRGVRLAGNARAIAGGAMLWNAQNPAPRREAQEARASRHGRSGAHRRASHHQP